MNYLVSELSFFTLIASLTAMRPIELTYFSDLDDAFGSGDSWHKNLLDVLVKRVCPYLSSEGVCQH